MRRHWAQGQVLAVPSSREGLAMVYLEALGFGLPPIATSQGASAEVLEHGFSGFLVEPGDTSALTDHLNLLMTDRQTLLRMSLAARETYDHHPTWRETGQHIHRFLLDLRQQFSPILA